MSDERKTPFPIGIFLTYVLFYAGQAIYNVYINLYLDATGFTKPMIGFLTSATTVALLAVQPLWGIVSDKSKSKNRIIAFLMFCCAVTGVMFYCSSAIGWVLVCYLLFSLFFNPSIPLQDDYTLQRLDGTGWDFGQMRLGGTLGYAACAAVIGFFVKDNYKRIFLMITAVFAFSAFIYLRMPALSGYREKRQKVRYTEVLKDKRLVYMCLINIVFTMGTTFFHQYYSIYFKNELGASEGIIGLMSTFGALAEFPFFWYAGRLQKRFGTKALMVFAGFSTAARWLLIAGNTDPIASLFINMLSGCGFVGFHYSLVRYINDNVPKEMRSTAQSMNSILATFVARILFAPISGLLTEHFSMMSLLLFNGILMGAATVVFMILFKEDPEVPEIQ